MLATETTYPVTFRKEEAAVLGQHLLHHDSVVLIGMKRVGIHNFLRFFLHHPLVLTTYLPHDDPRLFIVIDLNDLVERDIGPFWTLTLKRITDAIEEGDFSELVKTNARRLFTESIQLKDVFVTVDNVKKAIHIIADSGSAPTLIFDRFDRLKDAITQELFHNLQGIKDATRPQISYLFTSFRPLWELRPDVFTKADLTVFSHDMYLPPAKDTDMQVILENLLTRFRMNVPEKTRKMLLEIAGGHVQYLHVAVLKVKEMKILPTTKEALISSLTATEEMTFQSEELYESLTQKEQEVLVDVVETKTIPKNGSKYLQESGMVTQKGILFSPLFAQYVTKIHSSKNGASQDFTKKEFLLYSLLLKNQGELCERDTLIAAVWPEYQETGVSDWAVDRLVARVRAKLKTQESPYEIVTVITRGYKFVTK
jgi:hypothetical protein